MPNLEGVDVSHHEGAIGWDKVKDAGIAFAILKATEGKSFVDPRAEKNLARCREVGIVAGMYHFYRHDVDPAAQAKHFLANLGAREPGDLLPAIDVEAPGDGGGPITYPRSEVVARVKVVVDAVEAAIGRAPMIYTYPSAWKELTDNSTAFAGRCPLWIASYGGATPKLVGGWTKYTVWQYTDQGTVNGIGGGVDRDRFNGGAAELAAVRIGTLTQGALTKGGKAVFNQDGRVRVAAGVNSDEVGVLRGGTQVAITDGPQLVDGRDWWKIDNGAGTAGWSSSKVLSPA
ncbi:GH25 family lysozyme [Longimicrobium sp.]|uniref:GH25 family lysozyme n=1 Tax=Longimicrobium sp. TaxID=2029185 RepID=UPI002ED89F85